VLLGVVGVLDGAGGSGVGAVGRGGVDGVFNLCQWLGSERDALDLFLYCSRG